LGLEIQQIIEKEEKIIETACEKNPWFVPVFVKEALRGISFMLEEEKLSTWLSKYQLENEKCKNIGIIMAGNIPMVGFHDLLTVIFSENCAIIKLSHNDDVLIPYLLKMLVKIDPGFKQQIVFRKALSKVDAVIATGSDNTSRYFEHIFKNSPRLIRKNRTSCCIIDGKESSGDLNEIARDIFSYFGLGCRNVSKIYIPKGFNIRGLLPHFSNYAWISDHPKYYHNYMFQSSIYTLEHREFIDGQFFLLLKDPNLVSPVSCLYYEEYEDPEQLGSIITHNMDKIQCIVSRDGWFVDSVPAGKAQFPEPWDYADHIDTMKFLSGL